jgi:arylformamidase
MSYVDLTHDIYHHMPRIAILPEVEISCVFSIAEGKPLNVSQLTMATHAGTHIDAPYHAFQDGQTIDQIPLDTFVGPGTIVPVQARGGEPITAANLENSGVRVERGDILLVQTGWDAQFTSPEYTMHPYLGEDACQWVIERGVKLIALDFLSPDLPVSMRSPGFTNPAHRALLGHNIPIAENLRNLGALQGVRCRILAFPLRVRGGDGGQARFVAEPLS